MKKAFLVLRIAFTYIGTVVGAGFATGQEILQFYTRYGRWAMFTIVLATAMFVWLGTKLMLLAHDIKAKSYEDLNKHLFGPHIGSWISYFVLVALFGTNAVMLAGAGSIFQENFNLSYQSGLFLTLILSYFIIKKGIQAILTINSIVVPIMLICTVVIVIHTLSSPTADRFMHMTTDYSLARIWTAPLLYAAFNLTMSQAVLVPIGSEVSDRKALLWGGCIGGIGIGVLLFAGHFALSAQMPGIAQFEIPMGAITNRLGQMMQLLYLFMIFAEIFTTFVADVYGLSLQIRQHFPYRREIVTIVILALCYITSQIGFSVLLSTLYPLFGIVSMVWLVMIMRRRGKTQLE